MAQWYQALFEMSDWTVVPETVERGFVERDDLAHLESSQYQGATGDDKRKHETCRDVYKQSDGVFVLSVGAGLRAGGPDSAGAVVLAVNMVPDAFLEVPVICLVSCASWMCGGADELMSGTVKPVCGEIVKLREK